MRSFSVLAASLVAALVACGSDDRVSTSEPGASSSSTGGSTGVGGSGEGGAGGGALNGCSTEDPMACLYTPVETNGLGNITSQAITYTDVAGQSRMLEIELRRPDNPSGPMPVVLWSHGGSAGQSSANGIAATLGEAFVRAGYLFVAIAHAGRDRASYDSLCTTLGWSGCGETCTMDSECTTAGEGICGDGGCRYTKFLSWDRPNDVSEVIDALEAASGPGQPLEGLIDVTRILYAGHSGGAGGTMMVAGATRDLNGTQLLLDPRPMAFMSCSPQSANQDGFSPASYDGSACAGLAADPSLCLTRPHLLLSGVGDDVSNEVAEARRQAFDLAPATGQRYLAWNVDEAARHGTFNFKADACESYAQNNGLDGNLYPARCNLYLEGQLSVALAFADAFLRDHAPALDYLGSQNIPILFGGQLSWETK